MEEKIPCKKCGAKILPRTAQKTNGKCMPCFHRSWYYCFTHLPSLFLCFLVAVCSILVLPFIPLIILFAGLWLIGIYIKQFIPYTQEYIRIRKRVKLDLKTIRLIWATARGVHVGVIGFDAKITIEYSLIKKLIDEPEIISTSELITWLTPNNPTLSAYCFFVLIRREDFPHLLESLPKEIFECEKEFEYQIGCTIMKEKLGHLFSSLRQ